MYIFYWYEGEGRSYKNSMEGNYWVKDMRGQKRSNGGGWLVEQSNNGHVFYKLMICTVIWWCVITMEVCCELAKFVYRLHCKPNNRLCNWSLKMSIDSSCGFVKRALEFPPLLLDIYPLWGLEAQRSTRRLLCLPRSFLQTEPRSSESEWVYVSNRWRGFL